MSDTSPPHPVAEAMKWASRATTIAAEMVLPGIAGQWADERLGTSFLTLLGFAFGLSIAIYHLVLMAREAEQARLAKIAAKTPPKDSPRSETERPDERP